MSDFEYASCESVNVDVRGIARFIEDIKQKHMHLHALMILRHGKLICDQSFEPWSGKNRHMLFSMSKSFTSTAIGFAVQEGLLSVEDRLVDFMPDLLTNSPCENMSKIKIKHLLSMNTGHSFEPARSGDNWEKNFIRSYIEYEPGTHFMYNTSATYMLSAILTRLTGKTTVEYLKDRLFAPLGMSMDAWSEISPTGAAAGGTGLNLRVSDIAKLGQFYLQNGMWNGVQLLNEDWIKAARTAWSDNYATGGRRDWGSGYGYQFWMCQPEGVYRGDGAFGQYCVVCQKQDMVIAINSGLGDMQAVLTSIWENILPAVDAESNAVQGEINAFDVPQTNAFWEDENISVQAPEIKAEWTGKYILGCDTPFGNVLEASKDGIIVQVNGKPQTLPLSLDTWQHVRLRQAKEDSPETYFDFAAIRCAVTGDTLLIHICYTRTPFEHIIRVSFKPDGVEIEGEMNVSFGDSKFKTVGYKL